jgi:hypothetical protein
MSAPAQDSAAHTDHPLRHWDRTCPACNAGVEEYGRHAYDQGFRDGISAGQRDREALRHDIERHVKTCAELATENEALRKDAERFNYLQNAAPLRAQQFFWNYSSRKQRAEAIDKEIAALGGKS